MSFPGRRQHRRSTVVDIASLMIGGNEQNRDSQTQNDILLGTMIKSNLIIGAL